MNLKPVDPNKRSVKFDHNCSPYLSGDIATFPVVEAGRLVSKRIAHYVKQNKKGEWVPDDEPKGAKNEQANVESTDDDGQTGGDEGSGGGSEETGGAQGQTVESATKSRKRRRQRVKLD